MGSTEGESIVVNVERRRTVLVYPLPDPGAEAVLEQHSDVQRLTDDTAEVLAASLVDADAVIVRGPARLTAAMLETAPRLRVIGAVGSGTDNIDVEAATRLGIQVVHGAGLGSRAVAEWVLGAMVACHRGFIAVDRAVRGGVDDWSRRLELYRTTELTGTTVGIVGFGFIGRTVGELVERAFAARVLVYDPYLPPDADVGAAVRVNDLDGLLGASSTVTVHVPLTAATRNLVGRGELERIGPDGVLLNASRGGVVDEDALVAVLRAGRLKAAALDVFADEPPSSAQLAALAEAPNLMLSPHVAGITDRALAALSTGVVEGVLAALDGRPPDRLVDRAVTPRRLSSSTTSNLGR